MHISSILAYSWSHSWSQTLFSVFVFVSTILAARFRSWRNCAKCFSARRIGLLMLSGWFKPKLSRQVAERGGRVTMSQVRPAPRIGGG